MAVADAISVPRRTLVEDIAEGLIRYIAEKNLRPGDRLPSERELVRMVGASRLPLREAICVLKGLGVLEARHGKGIFVKRIQLADLFGRLSPLLKTQTSIDLRQLFEARLYLEADVAALAAAHRTDENLAVLAAAVEGMRRGVGQQREYVRHDLDFHRELARATGNPLFHVFLASIADLLRELQFRYLDRVDVREAGIGEHEAILAAVVAGDAVSAAAAVRRHIEHAMVRLET